MREDVKDLLHRAAGWYQPPPIEPDELARRLGRERRRGRFVAAAVAMAVFAAAGTLTWTAFRPSPGVGPGVSERATDVTASVNGMTVSYPSSWTLVDLWPLASSIASWPEPVGSAIDVPEGTPERGGLPLLQLSNQDLGLRSVCGVGLTGTQAVLYVALNGGPYRVNADGSPIWSHELSRDDGPCGVGWYAYRGSIEPGANGTSLTTPYLAFVGFGSEVTQTDRDAIFDAFSSLTLAPFDHLRPPAEASPSYVVPSSVTTEPLATGSLVFTREQPEGGCDLLAIEPDSAGERELTDTPLTCEALPAIAPGGSMVAVSLELDDIAVIDLATSALRRLTDDPTTLDGSPAWSPDGSQIAFSRGPELGPSHLYVMGADGTNMRQLTQGSGSDRNPAWSPDGTRIAFVRSGNYGYEVYVMDVDGSNVTAVTSVAAESAPSPAWSPDGSQIALDVDGAIYVMSADGTGLRRLSPELPRGVFDMHPSWSPDGTQIAFMRYTNEDVAASAEDGDIWIIDADGTDSTRVTRGPAIDSWPQWVSGSSG